MAANKFREDLYYRLNIFPIVMPDLSKDVYKRQVQASV